MIRHCNALYDMFVSSERFSFLGRCESLMPDTVGLQRFQLAVFVHTYTTTLRNFVKVVPRSLKLWWMIMTEVSFPDADHCTIATAVAQPVPHEYTWVVC